MARQSTLAFRSILAVMLCALLVLPAESAQQTPPPTVQEQVGQISTGSIVEAKTKLKNMKKVRGRLGAVTADGFEIQTVNGQKVDNIRLSFADVKSVADKSQQKSHTGMYILVGVCVTVGVMALIAVVLVAMGGVGG